MIRIKAYFRTTSLMRMAVFHAPPSLLWLKRSLLWCISNHYQLLNWSLQSPESLHLLCNGNTLEVSLTWAIKPDPGTNCLLHVTPEEYLMLTGVWLNVKPRQSLAGTVINALQVLCRSQCLFNPAWTWQCLRHSQRMVETLCPWDHKCSGVLFQVCFHLNVKPIQLW